MTKRLKHLTIGLVMLMGILSLPAISLLSSDDGGATEAASFAPTQEDGDQDQGWPIGNELADNGGNSWGG